MWMQMWMRMRMCRVLVDCTYILLVYTYQAWNVAWYAVGMNEGRGMQVWMDVYIRCTRIVNM
jgi:hypothetical protein